MIEYDLGLNETNEFHYYVIRETDKLKFVIKLESSGHITNTFVIKEPDNIKFMLDELEIFNRIQNMSYGDVIIQKSMKCIAHTLAVDFRDMMESENKHV